MSTAWPYVTNVASQTDTTSLRSVSGNCTYAATWDLLDGMDQEKPHMRGRDNPGVVKPKPPIRPAAAHIKRGGSHLSRGAFRGRGR